MPTVPPSSLLATAMSSTSIKLTWGIIPYQLRHGKVLGYTIEYVLNGSSAGSWTTASTNNQNTRFKTIGGLYKYSWYLFRVAGKTSKGNGVFTSSVLHRTYEDGMAVFLIRSFSNLPRSSAGGGGGAEKGGLVIVLSKILNNDRGLHHFRSNKAWFSLDRNAIVESYNSNRF